MWCADARSAERGFDLGGMMTVVVNHGDPRLLAFELKAAIGAAELIKRLGDFVERNFEFQTNCNRGQRVVNIVFARHSQAYRAEHIDAAPNCEARSERLVVNNLVRGNVGLRA